MATKTRTYPLQFYNIDNGRPPDQVAKELRALLGARPAILGLCETTNIKLPGVDDYRLLRDTSKPGRDNIAAYVKASLEVSDVKWWDMKQTWSRTEYEGTHPPRSILEFRAGRLRVWVAHQPPKGTDNTKAAQQESIDKLEARMAPWTRDDWSTRTSADKKAAKAQPRVLLWDANRKPDEDGPGPKMLGQRIDGGTAGHRIDCSTGRGGDVETVSNVRYVDKIGGVTLRSDHGSAFLFDLSIQVPA